MGSEKISDNTLQLSHMHEQAPQRVFGRIIIITTTGATAVTQAHASSCTLPSAVICLGLGWQSFSLLKL